MYILDGKVLPLGVAFTHDDIQYPDNWLQLSTEEDRTAIGITEVPDQSRPDDRFYWVTQNPDGSYTAVPKDLADLKPAWTAQINQTAYNLLSTSDWYVVRKAETSAAIPQVWTDYRSAIRTTASDTVTALVAASNIDTFIAAVTNIQWPIDPDAPVSGAPVRSDKKPK